MATYLRAYIRASLWVESRKKQWIEQYYMKDQGLSREDAEYATSNIGTLDFLSNWDQAIQDEQDTVNFMASETDRKPFDTHQIFDRRFEAVAAAAKKSLQGVVP